MNNLTNEQKIRLIAPYVGQPLILEKSGRITNLTGVNMLNVGFELCEDDSWRFYEHWPFKLLLTPISKISDADKIAIVDIEYSNNTLPYQRKIEAADRWIQDFNFSFAAVDYLRAKGYMVPYMGIIDLFKEGLAVDKTTLI